MKKNLPFFAGIILFLIVSNFCLAQEEEEYRIKIDDELEIFVWQNPDLTRTLTVQYDGEIACPLIGAINAAGLTRAELSLKISEALSKYVENPQVSVIVKKFSRRQVYIIGQIGKPGPFPLKKDMKLLELISIAGSFTDSALEDKIEILRENKILKVNLKKVMRQKEKDIILQAGDIVYVPRTSLARTNVFIRHISPVLTLITTVLTIIILISL
ncbi:MAG: polysaccharide biosynthesis/export family protein [bacterium]